MNDLERQVTFEPAWNKIDEGMGRHTVTARFTVRGDLGAVRFTLYTGWDHSSDRHTFDGLIACPDGVRRPRLGLAVAADLTAHSFKPRDGAKRAECDLLKCWCYATGTSSFRAEAVFDALTDGGDEQLWDYLTKFYHVELGPVAIPT